MINTHLKLGAWMLLLVSLTACEVINPEEQLPSYIHIEPFEFSVNATQGSPSAKITEAWLSIDGEFLGAYSLPADVPILKSGTVEIQLEAGIKDNGISALPEIYPFYAPYITQVQLSAENPVEIRPSLEYKNGINFAMLENFEQLPHFFNQDLDGNDATKIVISSEEVFEGQSSGKIRLTPGNSIIEVATDLARAFKEVNKDGIYVYLELNYKTDAQIAFGLIGNFGNNQSPEIQYEPVLFPKGEWNKIYLNLSQIVFDLKAESYQIAILSQIPSELEEATIWLDNIKLIHF